MPRALSRDEARSIYDGFGARQDGQGWYEDAAFDVLVSGGAFASARSVVELGCGTGRLAERLLRDELSADAGYLGLDISATMVALAAERLRRWPEQAMVRQTDGGFDLPTADRIVAAYVLDLLSESDIDAFLTAARGALAPGGRLCLAGLAEQGPLNRLWALAYRLTPRRLGGCRPMPLVGRLQRHGFEIMTRQYVQARGLRSQIIVAALPEVGV